MELKQTAICTMYIVASMMISCATSKDFPTEYKGDQIHFGQGGGFTGEVNYFVLLDDGRLFNKAKSDSTFTSVARWDKQFTQQQFENYVTLDLASVDHNQPGNLYYFIQYHSLGEDIQQIIWGREGQPAPQKVITFYQNLYQSTRKKS